jgi:uncharacterized membrane protein YjdF
MTISLKSYKLLSVHHILYPLLVIITIISIKKIRSTVPRADGSGLFHKQPHLKQAQRRGVSPDHPQLLFQSYFLCPHILVVSTEGCHLMLTAIQQYLFHSAATHELLEIQHKIAVGKEEGEKISGESGWRDGQFCLGHHLRLEFCKSVADVALPFVLFGSDVAVGFHYTTHDELPTLAEDVAAALG